MTDTKHPSEVQEETKTTPQEQPQPQASPADESLSEADPASEEERPEAIDPSQIDTSGSDAPPAGVFALELEEEPVTEEMLAQAYDATMSRIQEGEVVRGIVLAVDDEGVLVDIGYKSEGFIPANEFELDENGRPAVQPGDEVDVYIARLEDETGQVVLSKVVADQRRIWEEIEKAYDEGRPIKGVPTRRIKGGLRVQIGSMYAFLPASQVDIRPVQNLDDYIGRTLEMRVIKLNRRRRNIVLSRRVLLEEERAKMREELLRTLAPGQIRRGVVKNITNFGAFIDLGGLDGLLHKSDMSWGRISHPSEVVERDQELDVMILSINKETGKVSLGLKQLTRDPWEGIEERYPVGSDVQGRVVNIVEYGAFVELEEGVEGLIHVSEMSWTRRNVDPRTVLSIGEEVTVRVLSIDRERQKISLGLRQLQENPWDRLEREKPVGSRVRGRVRNITDFGVFVEIEEGIDGLIHVSDLSWTRRVEPRELFQEGDEIEAVILDIDRDRERVSLGFKQLEPDPWLSVPEKYKVGTTVEAEIVNVTKFGAFAQLDDGIEGLIHVSELSDEHVDDPAQVVSVGDRIPVKVINIDLQERRIGLSRKAYLLEQHRAAVEAQRRAREEAEPTARRERPKRPERREVSERTTLGDLIEQARRQAEEAEKEKQQEE